MTITHKEIFDEYTKTELKTGYIQKMAKKLNVPRSSVICELLKSGYKLDEIRRSDENNYKAGLNKYNKWKEEGEPEVTYEVPEVAPEVKEKKKYEKPEPVIVTEPEPVKEKPKSVVITSPKKEEKYTAEDFGKLRFRISELEEENRKAAEKIRECFEYKEKYMKLVDEHDLVTADFETVQNTMAAEYQKRLEAEKKLRKAERIICDRIYEDMPDEAE